MGLVAGPLPSLESSASGTTLDANEGHIPANLMRVADVMRVNVNFPPSRSLTLLLSRSLSLLLSLMFYFSYIALCQETNDAHACLVTQIVENAGAKLQAVAAVLSLLGMLLRLDGLVSPAHLSAVCCCCSACRCT
jgi:hypothetical protein